MEANINENELVGTTAIAYHLKNRIHLVIDSRVSNDLSTRKPETKLRLVNTHKYHVLFKKMIVLSVGQATLSKNMITKFIDWAQSKKDADPLLEIEVTDCVNYVKDYFNKLDKNTEYYLGTIIAGYDSIEKLYQFVIDGKVIKSTKIDTFTYLGSGSEHAKSHIIEKYRSNLTHKESEELAYYSIFLASFKDKKTDGNAQLLEVTATHCGKIGEINSLSLYEKYYHMHNESRVLFSVYKDSNGPISANDFEKYFSEPGLMKASHCVDHRVSKNKIGFYFHRLVFNSQQEAQTALDNLNENETERETKISSKFPYICSKLHDNKIKLYVSKASRDLLNYLINNTSVKWDEWKKF